MTFYSLKLRDWLTIPDDRFPSNPQLGQVVELTCMDLLVEFTYFHPDTRALDWYVTKENSILAGVTG